MRCLTVFVSLCALGGASPGLARAMGSVVDGGNGFTWEQIELEGTVCGNGSQYKFYVYDSPSSDHLLLFFEGGGACWDWGTCSGLDAVGGVMNRNGIVDDYMGGALAQYVSPVVNGNDPGIPGRPRTDLATRGWDIVYMPYCTGDVHIGRRGPVTYQDPRGDDIVWNHVGFDNAMAALDYLDRRFLGVDKLLVSGFSAGGVAALTLYPFIRERLDATEYFMVDDSGPVFRSGSNSDPLYQRIREAWNLRSVFALLEAEPIALDAFGFDWEDFGTINAAIATKYPRDRFAYTAFSTDLVFSRFSYAPFYPDLDEQGLIDKWQQDQRLLLEQLGELPNFSYLVSWERPINSSHSSTIITFLGSHTCPSVRQKRWYERWQQPWSQSWTCPGTFQTMDAFLEDFLGDGGGVPYRLEEPPNGYNDEDPALRLVAPLINDALTGL